MTWFRRREDAPTEATKARERAELDLAAIRGETPKYRALGESLREMRERNHFVDTIAATFRGETP